ncbi:MAG TPA: tRNA pseudouridine(55) synthase TruB [Pseudothermotoga sp.]
MNKSGVLLVDKPEGPTSHDIVNEVRKRLKIEKIGHTGTLDPFASGLLIIGIGNGTRILEYLMNHNKIYRVKMRLGIITDTFDITGQVMEERSVDCSTEQILNVIKSFVGTYKQVPPAYCARKYKGERLYELARQGKIIRLPPKQVTIYKIEDISIDGNDISFTADVSAGTYIRSLCMDIGYVLGCGATTLKLRRISIGPFTVDKAIDILKADQQEILNNLLDLSRVLDMPRVYLRDCGYEKIIHGNTLKVKDLKSFEDFPKDSLVQVIYQGQLISIAKTQRNSTFVRTLIEQNRNEPLLKPIKVLKEN